MNGKQFRRQFSYVHPSGATPTSNEFVEAQIRLEEIINPILTNPSNAAVSYSNVSLTGGLLNLLEHGLGRASEGWRITTQDAFALIYEELNEGADLSIYLPLVTTANCTVDIQIW